MFGPVRVVLVDDNPRHLITISTGLAAAQIPCTPYWYDRNELVLSKKLKPSPPGDGHPYMRVIFTDLNLEENTASEVGNVISPAVTVIKRLVGEKHGPYIVVFWTVMTFDIAEIRAELISRLKSNDIPLPVAVEEIPKGKFISDDLSEESGEGVFEALYAALYSRSEELRQVVESVMRKHSLLSMLAGWESRAFLAAGDAVRHLHSTALLGQLPNEELQDAIAKIAALVSQAAVGARNASENPATAFDAAMLDVLTDTFGRSVDDSEYASNVASVLHASVFQNIEVSDISRVRAALNTIQHLDTAPVSNGVVQRGLVVRLNDAIDAGFPVKPEEICRWDDFFFDPRREDPTKSLLTKVSEDTIRRFREIVRELDKAADRVIPDAVKRCREERNSDLKASYEALKAAKPTFRSEVEWVLVEAGAICDHDQRKSRTIRYLVGAIVPAIYVGDFVSPRLMGRLKNEALRLLGPFEVQGGLMHLLVSLKRFVAWQEPDHVVPPEPYLRLRAATVDYLLSCYAAWSVRPGIVEFN